MFVPGIIASKVGEGLASEGGTKETGGLFGLCAGSRAQNQQGDHMSEPSAAPVAAPASMPMARGAPAL